MSRPLLATTAINRSTGGKPALGAYAATPAGQYGVLLKASNSYFTAILFALQQSPKQRNSTNSAQTTSLQRVRY